GSVTTYKGTGAAEKTLVEPAAFFEDGVNFGRIPPGKVLTANYSVRVLSDVPDGTFIWSVASFKANELSEPQTQSAWALVVIPSMAPEDLSLGVDEQGRVVAGFTNNGSDVLNDFTFAATIPDGAYLVPGSTSYRVAEHTIQMSDDWLRTGANVGNVNPSQYVEFRYEIARPAGSGSIQVTMFANSRELPDWIQKTASAD
ncbi:MAG: hypothetical protein ACREMY_25270, partial [bacterium]